MNWFRAVPLVAAFILIVAGVSLFDERVGLIVAGVLLAAAAVVDVGDTES